MRADDSYVSAKGCDQAEILECLAKSLAGEVDYDACKAACANEEEQEVLPWYAKVSGKAAATQEVAYNAVNKKVGTITLKAGENDTTISSIVIGHSGLGDATAVSAQLFNNGVAVSSQKTISKSSQQVTLKLSPAVVMKANSSITFDVMASLSGASNETHNFSVEAVNVSNGKADGTPVALWTLKTTSYAAGTLTASLTSTATLKAGEKDKTIFTATLTPSKKGTINGFTITKEAWNEDLDALVANVKAYYNDEVIGTVKVTDEKIVISDLKLDRNAGQSARIDLRWDCIYVGNSVVTTGQIELNDVLAVEANTNENMGTAGSSAAAFTVAGADLKLTNKTTKEQTVVPGTSEFELLNVEVTAKSELEITDYTVSLSNLVSTSWNFVDGIITVYIDGEDYEMDANTLVWTKKESFTVDPKHPVTIRAVANFTEDATAATYKMSVTLSGAKTTEGNETISLWTKTVQWHTTKLQAATATIKAATKSAPVTESLFENKEQEIGRFAIKAASDKTTVKSLELTATWTANTGTLLTDLLNGKLKLVDVESEEEIDASFEDITAWVIAVKDMNLSIEKDTTVNVKVMANIGGIDDVMAKTLWINVTAWTFKTATTNTTWATLTPSPVVGKVYTFRATAPEITLAKASDNMFELTIKNLNDTGIALGNIKYRVRTDIANTDFSGSVCLVDDVNVISCSDPAVLWAWALKAVITTNLATKYPTLAENDELTLYILVDGEDIEPSVLRAEISELVYDGNAERYSISKLLNE